MEYKHTNNLINESSPYLLQHAHNPVNWFAWSDEALHKAKREDKPILVSIGYSACHWCHVMERESFEDESTAEIMNQYFINIKVDREERPDIDHIYMDAVQAITGTGGWPLNVFLTPDLKPFYGGTYFPPVRALNRSSWKEVLLAVANSYKEKKEAIAEQAESLMNYLINSNNVVVTGNENLFQPSSLNIIAENLLKLADKEWGGFGQAPKFPQTFSILYLLRHYFFTKDASALDAATTSLDKMMMGGMYDHLGGGFCRYSTDKRWHVPHFEKMLYDNALLIEVFTEAYQLTKKEEYAIVINETIEFIKNEMTSPEGGFYSALDADSEGVEGKFYTWQKKEVDELLKEDSSLFCTVFNISENGNWEHTNILWQQEKLEAVAEQFGLTKKELQKKLNACKAILLQERQKRIRPGLDNKVLLSWNALLVTSLCKAYAASGEDSFLELATRNISFIEENLFDEEKGKLFHSWNRTTNKQTAFLDDYAALIKAYISLHQVTANNDCLLKAKFLTDKVVELFSDEANNFFYFTSKYQTDVIIRKIQVYDGATPSGNSLMAENLHVLSVFFDIPAWRQRAEQMFGSIQKLAEKYPVSFGVWNLNFQSLSKGLKEIVLMDEDYSLLLKEVLKEYIPHKALQASSTEINDWPMLRGKSIVPGETRIYICENYACLKPVTTLEDFKSHLVKHF